jgi:hypothetical protein
MREVWRLYGAGKAEAASVGPVIPFSRIQLRQGHSLYSDIPRNEVSTTSRYRVAAFYWSNALPKRSATRYREVVLTSLRSGVD